MEIIDYKLLDEISQQAKSNPRLRMNYNFHLTLDAPAQRLLNALEPKTKLDIHRHKNTAETYILLKGKIRVLIYDESKQLIKSVILNPIDGVFGVNIPAGQFHTIEVLEKDSVIFEVKDGPYKPIHEEDILH